MSVEAVQGATQVAPVVTAPVAPSEGLAERRELIQAVRAVNAAELFGNNSELTFMLDRETQRPVVRVVDRSTNELIRQIPPEYVLRLAEQVR